MIRSGLNLFLVIALVAACGDDDQSAGDTDVVGDTATDTTVEDDTTVTDTTVRDACNEPALKPASQGSNRGELEATDCLIDGNYTDR